MKDFVVILWHPWNQAVSQVFNKKTVTYPSFHTLHTNTFEVFLSKLKPDLCQIAILYSNSHSIWV